MTTSAPAVNFDHLLPEGETLFDYQHVGVAYALVASQDGKGVFIADEQGLGKTRQAIVAAKARHCKKILVVCKASLKGNWANEVARCAPEWTCQVLGGSRPFETLAQCVIVNYDILATWSDSLATEGFDCLIIDESHYVKSLGTTKRPVQRTVAALQVSEAVRKANGLVLLLTGTPLLNRPVELVTQLQIIGRLKDVTPKPRKGDSDRDWEFAFKFSFCGPEQVQGGHKSYWQFNGASNLDLLNRRLRGSGYVRRLRSEVLGMNETRRINIPLSLNGALDTYRKAEDDLIRFLAATKGNEAARKAVQAEALVALSTLRGLAGEAKIGTAVSWIEDWLEENEGRKLVVFAWHKNVQRDIARCLGKDAIYLAGAKDIEAAKAQFNEGDARVIVCSLQAHREGHTLVGNGHNTFDVLFVENPWHPGAKSQAEDRINRIGQKAEYCFAHTLLATGTIDEWLQKIIDKKWVVFKAAADGSIPEGEITSVQNELLDMLAGKGVAV